MSYIRYTIYNIHVVHPSYCEAYTEKWSFLSHGLSLRYSAIPRVSNSNSTASDDNFVLLSKPVSLYHLFNDQSDIEKT